MKAGDALLLVGVTHGELGASLYLRECRGSEAGAPPPVDLALERRTGDFVRGLIASGAAHTVHDLSDGGLIVAAAEMALASHVGVTLTAPGEPAHGVLFGEDQARYLIAVARGEASFVSDHAKAAGVAIAEVGHAGGDAFAAEGLFNLPLADLRAAHEGWMPAFMAGT
jgi:phosphoribosylformylglycinamidine synthase